MFAIDERLRGLPASREQVVSLFQSINAPHLAVPNRKAGPAQAYILGMRGGAGFAVFVYLFLAESTDCAVYVSDRRTVGAEEYEGLEAEALAFVESMGFMMDNLSFRSLAVPDQEHLMRTLPLFQKEPRPMPGAAAAKEKASPVERLGRLFAAFCLLAVLAPALGCRHTPSEKEIRAARIHYDLGVQVQQQDPQAALREFTDALELDPKMVEAHNAMGVLLHLSFGRPEDAITHYRRALEERPTFSEAKINLANVYLDLKRYDDAIVLYREVLNDMLYPTPYIAYGNLGWALYKSGQVDEGVGQIKAALTTNPKFCLGYRNLGAIYEDRSATEEACTQYAKYREHCPEVADAHYREGVCLAKLGRSVAARQSFDTCQSKASADDLKEECRRLQSTLVP